MPGFRRLFGPLLGENFPTGRRIGRRRMDERMIQLRDLLGHMEMDVRMIRTERGIEGQGRSRRYDGDGRLVETTPWRTHTIMTVAEPEPAPWWRFWNRSPIVHDFPASVLAEFELGRALAAKEPV